jgi:hypothetical protein
MVVPIITHLYWSSPVYWLQRRGWETGEEGDYAISIVTAGGWSRGGEDGWRLQCLVRKRKVKRGGRESTRRRCLAGRRYPGLWHLYTRGWHGWCKTKMSRRSWTKCGAVSSRGWTVGFYLCGWFGDEEQRRRWPVFRGTRGPMDGRGLPAPSATPMTCCPPIRSCVFGGPIAQNGA